MNKLLAYTVIPLLLLFAQAGCGGKTGSEDSGPADDADATSDAGDGHNSDGEGPCQSLCCFDPELEFIPLGETLQLVSSDGTTCVLVRRRDDSIPGIMYKEVPFTLLSIRIGHQGKLVEIDDPQRLSWNSTHHNWMDLGEATTDDTRYQLQGGDMGNQYTITATGSESFGPIQLLPF